MKSTRIFATFFLLLLSYWGFGQDVVIDDGDLEFYRLMALSDAGMEESLVFSSEEDEADYWKDQFRFERELKEKKYSAYKCYIHFKRMAYLEHRAECDINSKHGEGYRSQADFYTTQATSVRELIGKN